MDSRWRIVAADFDDPRLRDLLALHPVRLMRTLNLHRRRGFKDGAAFGGYAPSGFNQFLHTDLIPA